jgi:hypothetical protein
MVRVVSYVYTEIQQLYITQHMLQLPQDLHHRLTSGFQSEIRCRGPESVLIMMVFSGSTLVMHSSLTPYSPSAFYMVPGSY